LAHDVGDGLSLGRRGRGFAQGHRATDDEHRGEHRTGHGAQESHDLHHAAASRPAPDGAQKVPAWVWTPSLEMVNAPLALNDRRLTVRSGSVPVRETSAVHEISSSMKSFS